ncbi:MAG: hypothetical protein K8L91_26065 [Anaerolineae bacterium]|nr:hypothetical protein [Anaerolineae bacterium]
MFKVFILSIIVVLTLTKPSIPSISHAQSSEIKCSGSCGLAWNPQNNWLAVQFYGEISIWNTEADQKIATFTVELGISKAIAWSSDGKLLAAGAGSYHVYIWDIEQQRPYRILDILKAIETLDIEGPFESVQALAWKPDGSQLAILHDGSVSLWNIAANTFEVIRSVDRSSGAYASSISWRPDGEWLAIANRQNSVELYDSATLQRLDNPLDSVFGYFVDAGVQRSTWSSDGYYHILAVQTSYAPATATLIVRRPDVRQLIAIQDTGRPYINALEWNPEKRLLAVGYGDWDYKIDPQGFVDIWRIDSDVLQVIETIHFENHVFSVSWSYDGNRLAIATEDGIVHILSPKNGTEP